MTSSHGSTSEPSPDAGIDELHVDIEATREELGDTISALGDKLDVKGRAVHKVADVEQKVADTVSETKVAVARGSHAVRENARAHPVVPAIAAALAALGVVVWLRRRRRWR